MSADPGRVMDALDRRFLTDYPHEAALKLEELEPDEVAGSLFRQPVKVVAPVWRLVSPQAAVRLSRSAPEGMTARLLAELPPTVAVRMLGQMSPAERDDCLAPLDPLIKGDLVSLLSFPADAVGRAMNTRVPVYRRQATAGDTLNSLRKNGMKTARSLFLVDESHRLTGKAMLQDVALAPPGTKLSALEKPVETRVLPTDPMEDVTNAFEQEKVLDVPVVDIDGVFLGAVTHDDLAHTIQEVATVDIQTMFGASREERALSKPWFAVRKRMPWLQINLLTAFLAASVVGIFENTIAQVTALAVLLPVVAGQSGNAGAQALAVTMRGLALREITVRQWGHVTRKEVTAGFVNGVAIAITCGIGVFIWSQSVGLVAVIASSMVLAMIAAGFAGAIVPIVLTRLGQDPATSSSIILTTVTDVAGFLSFLGIATLMMRFL